MVYVCGVSVTSHKVSPFKRSGLYSGRPSGLPVLSRRYLRSGRLAASPIRAASSKKGGVCFRAASSKKGACFRAASSFSHPYTALSKWDGVRVVCVVCGVVCDVCGVCGGVFSHTTPLSLNEPDISKRCTCGVCGVSVTRSPRSSAGGGLY